MKMYLINFIWASLADHGKIHSKHRRLSKKAIFFSNGNQSYEKESFVFQFFAGVALFLHIFILGPCQIAKL